MKLLRFIIPITLYIFWRYKYFIENPAILNSIEFSMTKFNSSLSYLKDQEAKTFLRNQKQAIFKFAQISFCISIMGLLIFHNSSIKVPFSYLSALALLAVFEGICIEWVFEHRESIKKYLLSPYLVLLFLPTVAFLANSDKLTQVPFFPKNIYISIVYGIVLFLLPYILITAISFIIVMIQLLIFSTFTKILKLVFFLNPNALNFAMSSLGLFWLIITIKY